jgi:hypothetical protein
MEADWEFEIGGDAPEIEARWPGFVDLRLHPEHAVNLPESAAFPLIAHTLAALNAPASPVWTSKCDIWPVVEPGGFDPDELDAAPGLAAHAVACYIDLLPKSDQQWSQPAKAVADCKALCVRLRAVQLRCCRVDLVIRRAVVAPDHNDLGVTAYFIGCGASEREARAGLEAALHAFAETVAPHAAAPDPL